ncbi:MAG: GTP-binding protein [Lachnospiraceae bacterium]|nr:GTP-binding protein [Lachnospiraceae bacterium]
MVKIDLITGFLGSGKTTFIRKYAAYLINKGFHIGILENDFGAVNVDMMLLQDLTGEQCELEMISGGCDRETHRRRFRTKLISMGMCGYDRVLVEPSGIYDVDEFFDVLQEEPLDKWYEIGNIIVMADARLEDTMSEAADYLLASEAANAGRIILSRADEASPEEISNTIRHLNRALKQIQCRRILDQEIMCRNVEALSDQDFDELLNCGYVLENYRKMDPENQKSFDTLYFMNVKMTEAELRKAAETILQDRTCGDIFRIKGFLKAADDSWLQLNATPHEISMKPIEAGQEVLIIIGTNLSEETIRTYFEQV